MQTRETLLDELRNLAAGTGPDITLFKFHEATGIHPCHVYRKWGNWTNLRLAAGLPPRSRIAKVYSDEHLFQELNRSGEATGEFPTISAFGRFSQRCWATLERRFGKRSEVWRTYFAWLQGHEPAQRPAYARDLTPETDAATIPGVTSHRTAAARQKAIDDYNAQLLFLDQSQLGPPPPGWKPGELPRDLDLASFKPAPPIRRQPRPRTETTAKPAAEPVPPANVELPAESTPEGKTSNTVPAGKSETAPLAETGEPRPPSAEVGSSPPSKPKLVVPHPEIQSLTPEEWNEFYNHPKAFPIVDIGAGLYPSTHALKDPRDPRPNPPPWERGFDVCHPGWTEIEQSEETPPHKRKPVSPDEWDLYFRGLWAFMIATTLTLAGWAQCLTPQQLAKGLPHREFGDGVLTRRETFQKFYTQHELREWINATPGVDSVAAAPGVFFVFRDEDLRQTFAAARYRRTTAAPTPRLSDALYQEHRAVLAPVEEFFATRGRLPDAAERDLTELERVFGSLRRAWGLVERVTGAEQWGRIRDERAQDLLVYLALAQFSKRPRMAALPAALQLDVKAFFGTYGEACRQADELLFSAGKAEAVSAACAKAECGKLTHEALYVHTAGLEMLPPILRVFEGCARNYVGVVDDANLVKLHRFKPKVSYLAYPEFDGDPHPALVGALVVPLDDFDVKYWNYADSPNPPILHRKEEFVPADYPGREKFTRLTRQEEKAGLFEETQKIGRREEWRISLENKGVQLRGHRLVSRKRPEDFGSTVG